MWTFVLVTVSVVGLWLAPRHWCGWLITTLSEFLWLAYAISLHSTSLQIMSVVWFGLNARACVIARNAQRRLDRQTPTCYDVGT